MLLLSLLLPVLGAGSLQEDPRFKPEVQASVTVQEGLCVSVPCSFSYPQDGWNESTPVYGYWFKGRNTGVPVATNNQAQQVQTRTRDRFQLTGNPRNKSCSLVIREAQKEDKGTYFFRVERGRTVRHGFEKSFSLKVTGVKKPEVYVPEVLEPNQPVTVLCVFNWTFEGCPAPSFSWLGAALSSQGTRSASHFSALSLKPRYRDHNTDLTCCVDFTNGVRTERTVRLRMAYAPRALVISISHDNSSGTEDTEGPVSQANRTVLETLRNGTSLPVLEGQSLRLVCVAHGNPPARLSWARGRQTLSPSQPSDPGVLELPRVQMEHEGEFTCRAQNRLGSQHVSLSLSVHYPARLLGPSCSWEAEGLRCSCSSRGQPSPSLRWRLGEELLEANGSQGVFMATPSSAGSWTNSSLSLHGGLDSSLGLSCETRNVHGAQSGSVLQLPGRPVPGGWFLLGAVAGAVAAALFSLCSCLIFLRVRTCRRKAVRRAAERDALAALGPISWGDRQECPPGSPPDLAPPAGATPTSGEDQKLHYASLSFQRLRPQEPHHQAATSASEYAEIKVRK
ncbi:sialic acid-binding Ig-like lectin 5 [Carlito syrichta]|uniref:Sialic acid-binding Ig-like lectin 5 n=1 Tax=Carlito syrichta TaxID=1868482 RepID=A0A1U7TRU8_CARSF|nr:sialic acid-binding Ig-like lectin 5 [Carlito syrichta]